MRVISFFGLLILSSFSHAWEPYNADSARHCFGKEKYVTDHLIPYPPIFPMTFLGEWERYAARFIVEPAFESPEEWVLMEENDHYFIRSWKYRKGMARGIPKKFNERAISKVTAKLIEDIWINELLETRYPACNNAGLDGVTFNFSANAVGVGGLNATTWSPRDNSPPLWLVEAGTSILDFSKSKDAGEDQLVLVLQAKRDSLFKYLADHGRL